MRQLAFVHILLLAAGAALPAFSAAGGEPSPLAAVEADVARAYPKVAVMPTTDLEALEKSGAPAVLLDARSDQEFAVSRIPGATRVDPGMSATQFADAFGGSLKGRKVVVYCAVGGRSSTLAGRIDTVAKQAGAEGVYSLQGGIFRWHNEKRPLIGANGPTDEVHPFSANAAHLIERQDGIAYTPGSSKFVRSE